MLQGKKLAAGAAAVAFGLAWLLGIRLSQHVYAPLPADVPRLAIPKGAGLRDVADLLRETGAARWEFGTVWGFRLWGRPRSVKAGVYSFKKGERLIDVFSALEAGRVDIVSVTFPEGFSAREMARVLETGDVTRAEDFLSLCFDPASPARWGLPGDSLEGFLFPDTYRFPREIPAREVADGMIRRFRTVSASLLGRDAGDKAKLLEWVTLASVVEKETGVDAERPLVAAVFRNRLRSGMRLQSDPTVIYGIKDFDGNLRREDLVRDSLYNTYARGGLPKGPIANPGARSLQAVLAPAEVPYLYFVSKNDGTHYFSASYGEHQRAVARYQRNGRK